MLVEAPIQDHSHTHIDQRTIVINKSSQLPQD